MHSDVIVLYCRVCAFNGSFPIAYDIDKSKPDLVYVRVIVPASFRTQTMHTVFLELTRDVDANTVTSIKAHCVCLTSALADCAHVSASLWVIHDIVRSSGRIHGLESLLASTEGKCQWKKPTGQHHIDIRHPISHCLIEGKKKMTKKVKEPVAVTETTPKGARHVRYREPGEQTSGVKSVETTPSGAKHIRYTGNNGSVTTSKRRLEFDSVTEQASAGGQPAKKAKVAKKRRRSVGISADSFDSMRAQVTDFQPNKERLKKLHSTLMTHLHTHQAK
jgi:hypothetical protein